MKAFLGLSILFLATAVQAATIAITSDRSDYAVGDTITLTITGDPQGGSGYGALGLITYDSILADTLAATQTPLSGAGGEWIVGDLDTGDGFSVVWNQIAGLEPLAADGLSVTTVQLVAQYGGTLSIDWSDDSLDFFGASAPGTYSVFIDGPAYVPPPPPEPPPVVEPPPPPPVIEEPPPPPPYVPPTTTEPPPTYEPPIVSSSGSGTPAPEPSGALIFAVALYLVRRATAAR